MWALEEITGRNLGLCTLRRLKTSSYANHNLQRVQQTKLTIAYSSSEKDNQENESHFPVESHLFHDRCDSFSRLDFTSAYDRPTASQL